MRLHRHMGRFEKMLENPIQSLYELYVIIGANFSWTWDVDSFVENVVEIWTTDW